MFYLGAAFLLFRKLSHPDFQKWKLEFAALLKSSEKFDRKRFRGILTGIGLLYVVAIIILFNVWYAKYKLSRFHFFDDSGEWFQMDKAGHVLTAYQESRWVNEMILWSGIDRKKSTNWAMGYGMGFQTSIELLDGFADKWGFSYSDMIANTTGAALFGAQEKLWGEQRIMMKVSNTPIKYPDFKVLSDDKNTTDSVNRRAKDLFGDNYLQTFFKDYNALIFWTSINIKSFFPESKAPDWLNVAVGYGAENLFGGFENVWNDKLGHHFTLDTKQFPRYRQMYISLDIDFTRLKTGTQYAHIFKHFINFLKCPAPAIELSAEKGIKFHPLLF